MVSGNVQSRPEILQSCGRCVLEAIRDFCCDSKSKYLTVHLVNNKEEITGSMRSLFEAAENRSSGSEKPRIPPRSSSFDALENVRDDQPSTKTRIYSSMGSSGRGKSDTDSRVGDDRDELARNKTDTETPGAVGGIQETDDRKPDTEDKKKKAKGNLRIIVDD